MAEPTIPALLAERRQSDGDMRALVTADDAVTYAELDERSAALAGRLVAAGVVKGDRVALLAPNGIDWAVTAFAVMRIGAVLVPLSTLLRPPELLAQLQVASVSHLVTAPTFRDRDYLADLEHTAPGLVAHVVGVPDETKGQLVAALVRAPADGTVDLDDLRARLKERLSAYKVPKRVAVVAPDEVPMMSSGKLDLRAIGELLDG